MDNVLTSADPGIREAAGVPLRVVRLSVPLPDIERRLA